jgi:hypothetical protein
MIRGRRKGETMCRCVHEVSAAEINTVDTIAKARARATRGCIVSVPLVMYNAKIKMKARHIIVTNFYVSKEGSVLQV